MPEQWLAAIILPLSAETQVVSRYFCTVPPSRVSACKEEGGSKLYMQGVRHTHPKMVKQTKRGSDLPLSGRCSEDTLHAPVDYSVTVEQRQADKKDASCSLDRYSCLAEALQCAPTSAAPSMPGIQRQFIPQAGRHPPGAPTRKLPSNMWDSAIADNKHHSPDWSAQLPERASGLLHKPLIADPITSTNGLLLRLESAKTGSLTSKVLDSASSAYTGTFAALHNDSSRLPMQLYKEGPSSAQLPPIMEDSFVGCSGSLFSNDSNGLPKLSTSAPRPSSPSLRAHSSSLAASDLVLSPRPNALATPAWPQQTPSSVLPNLPVTTVDPLMPVPQPQQALLQPLHHGPSQPVLQGPLPVPFQAPLLAPSQPSFQFPFQFPFQEPFLDDLQLHDWHALQSALSLQT
ncbi:MAG: hypothetical protein FRX49_03186 [Trebouxia sp. A1-2]|nr:MAG: hypothetical protein FRX49_03186 [Trebouxia sp. A1-2]